MWQYYQIIKIINLSNDQSNILVCNKKRKGVEIFRHLSMYHSLICILMQLHQKMIVKYVTKCVIEKKEDRGIYVPNFIHMFRNKQIKNHNELNKWLSDQINKDKKIEKSYKVKSTKVYQWLWCNYIA